MDLDSPGPEDWRRLNEQQERLLELRNKTRHARAALRRTREVLEEKDTLVLSLLQNAVIHAEVDFSTLLRDHFASLQQTRDVARQHEDEVDRLESELLAAESDMRDTEVHQYTADKSSNDGDGNQELCWEHYAFGKGMRQYQECEKASQSSENLIAGVPVGHHTAIYPENMEGDTFAGAHRYLALLGDIEILREQLVDLEGNHAQVEDDIRERQRIGLGEAEELKESRLSFPKEHATLLGKITEAKRFIAKYADGLHGDINFDHDLHFTPTNGPKGEKKREQAAEYCRNLQAAEASLFGHNDGTEGVDKARYINSWLLHGRRKITEEVARSFTSRSARKDESDTSLSGDDSPRRSRRGRGQRKNKAYWNWRENNSDLGLFERDVLVSRKNGSLTVPGIARLDSSGDIPFCISEKYLKQQGRGREIDANLTDDERRSVTDDQLNISGIIRKLPFRVRGTSRVFFQDFIVSKALDDVADMVIGWQFMWQEFKLLFDNVRENVAGWFKGAVSTFAEKIASVSSELRRRAERLISRVSWPPPPRYSERQCQGGDFL